MKLQMSNPPFDRSVVFAEVDQSNKRLAFHLKEQRWEFAKFAKRWSSKDTNMKVKVADVITARDYTDEGNRKRIKFKGQIGFITVHHDSHGSCYDVMFQDGMATYDPDELQLIS